MVRTGAVVSSALDADDELSQHFLQAWNRLIEDGLPARLNRPRCGFDRLPSADPWCDPGR